MDQIFPFAHLLPRHPPSGWSLGLVPQAYTVGNRAQERGAPCHSRQGWASCPWLLAPNPESLSSISCPLPHPDALFMTHYSPPAGAQMLPARAVTSLCPREGTKGSSCALLSLPPMQFLWVSAGSWHLAQPVPSSHPREPPWERFPLCQASRHFAQARSFPSRAAAVAKPRPGVPHPTRPEPAHGWPVCVRVS